MQEDRSIMMAVDVGQETFGNDIKRGTEPNEVLRIYCLLCALHIISTSETI